MSITYSSFVSEIATLTTISSTILVNGDTNFQGIMPAIIDYAEGRLWRELDLPIASIFDNSVACVPGVRSVDMSTAQGTVLVIETINLKTSAGAPSSTAMRVPLIPTSKAVVDAVYPSAASSVCGLPQYFARVGDTTLLFGPTPDQAYSMEVYGTIRPTPLSASNSSTWLTQNLPELMVAAGMIFASGHMRNFGAQADDPKMAQSWEGQYGALMKSANVDSARMKFEAEGWTSQQPSAIAAPPRV